MANVAPSGGVTLPAVSTALPYSSQLEEYYAAFVGELGQAEGTAFLTYANAHPLLTAKQAASEFVSAVAAQDVGTNIAEGTSETGNLTNTAGQSTVSALGAVGKAVGNPLSGLAAIGNFFNLLTQRQTLIRIAEGVIGLGLIVVGLAKLAEGTPIGKAAGTVARTARIM
jgi:hypothetical protein